jgi:hypothetical protein
MKYGTDGAQFDDRGECLIKVDPPSLLEPVNNPTCFLPF